MIVACGVVVVACKVVVVVSVSSVVRGSSVDAQSPGHSQWDLEKVAVRLLGLETVLKLELELEQSALLGLPNLASARTS